MKMLVKMILTCEILLTVGKNHDRRPWPETRIFIEMDSACRNQQGIFDEVENTSGAVENLGLRPRFSTSPSGPGKR